MRAGKVARTRRGSEVHRLQAPGRGGMKRRRDQVGVGMDINRKHPAAGAGMGEPMRIRGKY